MANSDGFWETFSSQMYGGTRIPRIPSIIGSLWETCGLQIGSTVADICCGRGYSSIELALRGAKVQAVDSSIEFIENLNQAAGALNFDITARQGNAEDIYATGSICTTMILWNSLGYQNLEIDMRILANARKSGHAGGSLALELATLEQLSIEPYKVTDRSIGESSIFRRTRDLDVRTGVLSAVWEIIDESGIPVHRGHFSQRVYPKAEIVRIMNVTGWSYVTDSDKTPMNCEPTGTLFIGRIKSNTDGTSCLKCRGISQ